MRNIKLNAQNRPFLMALCFLIAIPFLSGTHPGFENTSGAVKWKKYVYPEAGFVIAFPEKPKESQEPKWLTGESILRGYINSGKAIDKSDMWSLSFTVKWLKNAELLQYDPIKFAGHLLEAGLDNETVDFWGELVSWSDWYVDGHVGVMASTKSYRTRTLVRIVVKGDLWIKLIVKGSYNETQDYFDKYHRKTADKFFDSFQFLN